MEGANHKETWSSENKLGKYNSLTTLWFELMLQLANLRVIGFLFFSHHNLQSCYDFSYVEIEA